MDAGTDGGNSDIGVLADFSDDEEKSQVKQFSGCRIPGFQCEGRIEYMEWGSEDMTDTDDSEWEDPDEREKRLYVERYNFDLIEGMTQLTYTPPTRKYRRRRYEDRVKYGPELQESTSCTSELESQSDEESLNSEPTVQPGTVADEDIHTHGDEGDTYGTHELTGLTGCDADSPSGELSENVDRPVMKSVTARSGIDTDFPSNKHSELIDRPVTKSVRTWAGIDTDLPSEEHSDIVDRPVTESATARAGINTDFHSSQHSELVDRPVTESGTTGPGIYRFYYG